MLDLAVGPAETEKFWSAFLRALVGRGLVGAVVLEQSDEWQVGRCYMAQHSPTALTEPNEGEPTELEQAA